MISAFKKIWDFAGSEQKNIRKSIVLALFHSVFYALQFAAVYVVLKALTSADTSKLTALYALGIMALSIAGRIVLNTYSQLRRVHAGYFMVANKRISIGNKLRSVPMGYFSKNNLGQMTAITTTTLTDVENTAPVALVTVLGGFINSVVFALSVLLFDWRIGVIVFIGMAAFIWTTSLQEKHSRKGAPERQRAQETLVEKVLEAVQGISVIKSFHLGKESGSAVDRAIQESCNKNLAIEKQMTPYQPLVKQYTDWLTKAVRGDFGNSYNTGKPIINELSAALRPTIMLASMALLFTVLLSIPFGVLSAARKGGFADKSIYLFGIVCMSVPNYWIGFMLMIAFAVNIPLFGIMGADGLKDFVLPALAVAIPTSAANIRVFRSSLLDGYNSDFVMYARARGISEIRIAGMVSRYALPPLVTLLGQSFGFTIAGSAMVEFVFSIPGIGSMLVTALGSRDTVTINACVLVIAVIFVAVNFLAEVVNSLLNPKEQSKERVYDT